MTSQGRTAKWAEWAQRQQVPQPTPRRQEQVREWERSRQERQATG